MMNSSSIEKLENDVNHADTENQESSEQVAANDPVSEDEQEFHDSNQYHKSQTHQILESQIEQLHEDIIENNQDDHQPKSDLSEAIESDKLQPLNGMIALDHHDSFASAAEELLELEAADIADQSLESNEQVTEIIEEMVHNPRMFDEQHADSQNVDQDHHVGSILQIIPESYPRHIKDLSIDFPMRLWSKIFTFIDRQTIINLAETCSNFNLITRDPSFRADYFLSRYRTPSAIHQIYQNYRWALTQDLLEILISLKIPFPKYSVEKIYKSELISPKLPYGALEYILAQGYKLYSEQLHITVDSNHMSELQLDDALDFDTCFGPGVDIPHLNEIVFVNGFVPLLAPPFTHTGWTDLMNNLYRLFKMPEARDMAIHLLRNSGDEDVIDMFCKVVLSDLTIDMVRLLDGYNIRISMLSVSLFLMDLGIEFDVKRASLDVLKPVDVDLRASLVAAVDGLFRDSNREALHLADLIITEYALSDDDVGNALLVAEHDVWRTRHGTALNGLTDGLWQFILARYKYCLFRFGPDSIYTQACLNDLVVGGLVTPRKDTLATDDVASFTESMSIGSLGDIIPDKKDAKTRDSIEVLLETKVALRPNLFRSISRIVYSTKSIHPRHVDIMSRIERGLLGIDTTMKWNKGEWCSVFENDMLEHPNYSFCKPQIDRSYREGFMKMISTSNEDRELQHVKKFYNHLHELYTLITDPLSKQSHSIISKMNPEVQERIESDALVALKDGPFGVWIKEIEGIKTISTKTSMSSLLTSSAGSAQLSSWFGGFGKRLRG